jgi:Ca-activated chloride channel family protein
MLMNEALRKSFASIVFMNQGTNLLSGNPEHLSRIRQMMNEEAPEINHSPRLVLAAPVLFLLALAALISLSETTSSQDIPSAKNDSGDYTLRVNANLVLLSATVVDHHNALVSGLVKEDFQVYEDHVLQSIKHFSHEDIPVSVGLVIDNSGSMASKRADVINAALLFAQSSNPQDQMFVVNFNEHVSYGLPADTPFTDRRDQLQRALSAIHTIGETALYDAIASSLDHLKLGKCDKKVLIVISDGGDNASKHNLAQVIAMAKASDAIIYAIGIFDEQDGDQNPGVLKRFAKETGGEAFFPESSKEIATICEGIARDIRNQYALAYVPALSKLDGGYRTVEVKAGAPGHGRLSVRTRTGYSVPLALQYPAIRSAGHDAHE